MVQVDNQVAQVSPVILQDIENADDDERRDLPITEEVDAFLRLLADIVVRLAQAEKTV